MPHPSENNINRVYFSQAADPLTVVDDGSSTHFRRVVCSVAGTLSVFGGIAEFVDVSALANDAAAQVYTNPTTGVAFTDKAEAVALGDGTYEKHTASISVPMVAGDVMEGKFTKLTGDATIHYYAYAR